MPSGAVVIAYAKILILKQVTTVSSRLPSAGCCYCLCKDTNSQASHNETYYVMRNAIVVIAYAKILILKQVTTLPRHTVGKCLLLLPMQRY